MTGAILFALAVEEGLQPAPGAAPYGVLSRQLPRLLVSRLNHGSDRGVRFFPFVGNAQGRRRFLRLTSMLPPDRLRSLLGKVPTPSLLVDGEIREGCLHLRLQDTRRGQAVFDDGLGFEPRHPEPVLRRALFEITGALGWPGEMPSLPDLQGEALNLFLCAHDELLSLEANLVRPEGVDPLEPARKAVRQAPESPEVREVFTETCIAMVRQGVALELVEQSVQEVVGGQEQSDPGFLFAAAAILEACGKSEEACALYTASAGLPPGHFEASVKSAHLHFSRGRYGEAREVLSLALDRGPGNLTLVAQLAAVEERLGNLGARDELFDELLRAGELPPKVARMVAVHLIGKQRYGDARHVAERTLSEHPREPALHLERARAILLLGGGDLARDSLRRCLDQDPSAAVRTEAKRLLAFTGRPGVLGKMQSIQVQLDHGEPGEALVRCRRLVRQHRELAEAWLLLGSVHQKLGNLRRAARALRRAVLLEPRQGDAHNRLGILLVSRGRLRQGYRHLIRAAGELPEDPAPRIHLAQACRLLGRREEARRCLEEAVRLGGDPELIAAVRERFFH